jgi:hypothetical protein
VWPRGLQDRVVFFRIKVFRLRREGTADVGGDAGHDVCGEGGREGGRYGCQNDGLDEADPMGWVAREEGREGGREGGQNVPGMRVSVKIFWPAGVLIKSTSSRRV